MCMSLTGEIKKKIVGKLLLMRSAGPEETREEACTPVAGMDDGSAGHAAALWRASHACATP